LPRPRMKRSSSWRLTEWPTPRISWVADIALPPLERPGRVLDGLDDVLVAGGAGDVGGERRPDLFLRRAGILGEQRCDRQHHPGRTEAALETVLFAERVLNRVEPVRRGEPLDGRDVVPVRLHGE